MGLVMVTCPVTGQAVATGIDTEFATLQQAAPFQARVQCTACGAEHAWSQSDAWISERPPCRVPNGA